MVNQPVEVLAAAGPDGHLEGIEGEVGAERTGDLPADHIAREDVNHEGGPADLVDRQFRARAANRLWVADPTYVRTFSGWVYVEYATLSYVDWFNQKRLPSEIGMLPPAELEASYYALSTPAMAVGSQ